MGTYLALDVNVFEQRFLSIPRPASVDNIEETAFATWENCRLECTVREWNGTFTERVLSDLFTEDVIVIRPELPEESRNAWDRFAKSCGMQVDLPEPELPWWLAEGLAGGASVGLMSPCETRDLVIFLQQTETIGRVLQITETEYPGVYTRDITTLFDFLREAAKNGNWLLGYEWAT